ncbi:hypothetical protein [Sphingomonas oligophenolica]|uniref:hypothetical protein n=1 Tax=Sphingomonas oligophenolica TaxID=301154 RepID=UPI0018845D48|nr:hypothetical protein [Sphingomonas oligophenolica]
MISRFTLIAGGLSLLPAAALAQTAPPAAAPSAAAKTPTVGATVLDSAGTPIGTIASITAQAIVLDMDGTKVAVPPASVGATAKGLAMAMTKASLQAAQAQQQAQAQAALQSRLVAGTAVSGINGAPIGTVKANDGSLVTLSTSKGDVKLPTNGFTMNQTGQVMIAMTEAQFDAAVSGASGGTTGADATTGAAATTTSPGVSGTTGTTGTDTMAPPEAPATTTAPAPSATPTAGAKATMSGKSKAKATTPH